MFIDAKNSPEEKPVLVLGAAITDIVIRLVKEPEKGTSTPAHIRTSFGGTARNFAENLALLGQPVTLFTVVGKDPNGQQLLKKTKKSGVNINFTIKTKDHPTGTYVAVINREGELQYALDDINAMAVLTPEYLVENSALFEEATMLFLDANLPPKTIETAMHLAQEADLPVVADPTTVQLADRFTHYLPQIKLITPNHKEAEILCKQPVSQEERGQGLEAAKHLVAQGVELAIITLAEFGVSYATSETSGYIPAIRTKIVDPTGGGDALSAAVVFSLINGISIDEAVRLGISAASLTLRHPGAVRPDLSLELLYDNLV